MFFIYPPIIPITIKFSVSLLAAVLTAKKKLCSCGANFLYHVRISTLDKQDTLVGLNLRYAYMESFQSPERKVSGIIKKQKI